MASDYPFTREAAYHGDRLPLSDGICFANFVTTFWSMNLDFLASQDHLDVVKEKIILDYLARGD